MRVAAMLLPAALFALASCEQQQLDADGIPRLATTEAAVVLERPRAPGEDNGLELARWSVTGDDARIRRGLARHALRDAPPLGATTEALERCGLRATVVRDADLPSLLAELGGTTTAIAVWHGQITDWRELWAAPVDPGHVVMIDGKAERLGGNDGGSLRCMARGWTVPLEDGAIFELHLAFQLISSQSDYSALLNRDRLRGRQFDEASIQADMPRDTALVLVGTAPAEEEPDPEGPQPTERRSNVGPPVALPPTIGELLLTDTRAMPPRRIVLVMRVRLPDTLFPASVAPATQAPSGVTR